MKDDLKRIIDNAIQGTDPHAINVLKAGGARLVEALRRMGATTLTQHEALMRLIVGQPTQPVIPPPIFPGPGLPRPVIPRPAIPQPVRPHTVVPVIPMPSPSGQSE